MSRLQTVKHEVAPRKKVLVVAGDILPLPGLPTTGAGMRAWSLAQGLRSRGHHVQLAMTTEAAQSCGYKPDGQCLLFDQPELDALVWRERPEVLVFQHWCLANLLKKPYPNTVIDLHGPLVLENLFRIGPKSTGMFFPKLRALSRAEFFCCAGERQRNYFLGWLQAAGFDLRQLPIQVFPYSLDPVLPEHEYPSETTFVYGGVFLPWQNPTLGLRVLLEELEGAGTGHLNFFGGKHPWLATPGGEFPRILALLNASPRATIFPMIGRSQLIENYRKSSVAWDVMSHNCERGMAITSRTVEYLWAGLPVVYNNYSELSEHIRDYEAGWLVDPENEEQMRATVREVLTSPEEVRRRGANAQRLVRDRFTWDRAIEPLHRYVCDPQPAARFSPRPVLSDHWTLIAKAKLIVPVKRRLQKIPPLFWVGRRLARMGRWGLRLLRA